jgi:2,5-diketo-D-gluconate reductase A
MTNPSVVPTAQVTGARIPMLGLGTWQLRGDDAYTAVTTALELGYRHVDTATNYGNQREVGRALADAGLGRDEVFVTTKLPPDAAGRERETLARSLDQLGLDHLDLWLIHWPPHGHASPEVWQQLVDARDEGLVRAIGVSNYSLAQLDELADTTGVMPSVNQIRYSPADHDPDLLAAHRERGVVVEGYSPLKRSPLDHDALTDTAANHGVSPAQVVLRWHLQRDVVVIPKSGRRERLAENLDVFDFTLTLEELDAIDAIGS